MLPTMKNPVILQIRLFTTEVNHLTGNINVKFERLTQLDDGSTQWIPHRHVLEATDDLIDQDPRVAAQAQAAWTPEIIAAASSRKAAHATELARQQSTEAATVLETVNAIKS